MRVASVFAAFLVRRKIGRASAVGAMASGAAVAAWAIGRILGSGSARRLSRRLRLAAVEEPSAKAIAIAPGRERRLQPAK